jgi:hypothetical protein
MCFFLQNTNCINYIDFVRDKVKSHQYLTTIVNKKISISIL